MRATSGAPLLGGIAFVAFVSFGTSIPFFALLTYRSRSPWITLRTSRTSRARRSGDTRITLVALGSGRSGRSGRPLETSAERQRRKDR